MIAAIKRAVGKVVRSEAYHATWLCVYVGLVVALILAPALQRSVALVLAISIETAIATHAGAWSAEKAAENGS